MTHLVAAVEATYDGFRDGSLFFGSRFVRALNSAWIRYWKSSGSRKLVMSSRKAGNIGVTACGFQRQTWGRTMTLRLCDLAAFFHSKWIQNGLLRLFDKILCSGRSLGSNVVQCSLAPASRSSFSLPVSLLASISSPVPLAPCFPLRSTIARAVVGL